MPSAAARKMYLMEKIGTIEKDGIDLVKETEGLAIAHLRELIVGIFCQENSTRSVIDNGVSIGLKRRGIIGETGIQG